MKDSRTEVRMMCSDVLEVRWKDAAGRVRRSTALLEDISGAGACLQLETPVHIGALVQWRFPRGEFTGIVRYCVYREIGYFAGVQFARGTRWSLTSYKPRHLLDLQQLVAKIQK